MHLGQLQIGDPGHVSHEPIPAERLEAAAAQEPRGHRMEPIGPDDEAGRDRRGAAALGHDRAFDPPAIADQIDQLGALEDPDAGPPGGIDQDGIENSARQRNAGALLRHGGDLGEQSGQRGAPRTKHPGAVERDRVPEDLRQHAEEVELADRFRAHELGANLVAGKRGSVHRHHPKPRPGQPNGRRRAARAQSRDQDVGHSANPARKAATVVVALTRSLSSQAHPAVWMVLAPHRWTRRSLARSHAGHRNRAWNAEPRTESNSIPATPTETATT